MLCIASLTAHPHKRSTGRNCKTYRKLARQRNVGKCIESESKNNEFTMKMIVLI